MMSGYAARAAIQAFAAVMPAMPSTVTTHVAALKLAADRQVRRWNALIIAVRAEHNVKTLVTEDTPSAATLSDVKCG